MKVKTKYTEDDGIVSKVKIEDFDVWSVDTSIAIVAIPLIQKLKETQKGYFDIDPTDTPYELGDHTVWRKYDEYGQYSEEYERLLRKRWGYILDEILWGLEQSIIGYITELDFYERRRIVYIRIVSAMLTFCLVNTSVVSGINLLW